jgi:hypothetical protein
MFIISALMTIPVAITGVFVWPGTPGKPNKLFLTDADLHLAVKRLQETKADTEEKPILTKKQLLLSIVKDWKIYVLTIWAVFFWNAGSTAYGGYLLWLKSLKRYSTPKVNQLGTTAPALGIFYVLFVNFSSDLLWGPSGAIAFAHVWNFTAMVILAVWTVPEGAKWFAFNITYTQVAMSSVLYGWSNEMLRHNTQARSVILVFMNLFAQSTTAWTGVLVFKTVEAPRFLKGWTFCAINSFLLIVFTYAVVGPLARREERKISEDGEDLGDRVAFEDVGSEKKAEKGYKAVADASAVQL